MAGRTPNEKLKDHLVEAGWTYEALARAVRAVAAECGEPGLRTNKAAVQHWCAGVRPKGETGRFVAVALSRRLGRLVEPCDIGWGTGDSGNERVGLSLDGDPIDALLPMWRFDVDRRRFLTGSAYSVAAAALPLHHVAEIADRHRAARSGQTVGMPEVAAIEDMVAVFSVMDERHGGRHGRSALVTYLRDDVTPLCRGRFATPDVRSRVLSAAARGVHLLGWKSYDMGYQGLAQRYYLQSYALAVESGMPGHDGFVMRTMAMQGLEIRRPEHTLALTENGLARAVGQVDAHTEAQFRIAHGETMAKAGRRREALAEADAAHALLQETPDGDVPFWARQWGPPHALVYSRTAKLHQKLGDHQRAADFYRRASKGRPAEYARIKALDLSSQAEMELKQGGIEEACGTWGRAMDEMAAVRSVRTLKAVRKMRTGLSGFRARGARCAGELDERAVAFLRAA